jgi:glycosyltransferase involved in cell wall biosynthesis/tetratricopeptide (TPR) repeat protein
MAIQVLSYGSKGIRASYDRSPIVTLFTDSSREESIPQEVREAADRVVLSNGDPLNRCQVDEGSDGTIGWLEGDTLKEGTAAALRKNLRTPGRRTLVPVHYPYLAEADLITLQPRSWAKGEAHDYWGFNIRVHNDAAPSEKVLLSLRASAEPWAQLSLAVALELVQPCSGCEQLALLWRAYRTVPPAIGALALRNLVVVLMRHGRFAQASELLEKGISVYDGCAELPLLAAFLSLRDGQPKKAVRYLTRLQSASRAFIGSGGENGYRFSWLLGLCDLQSGDERSAFGHFIESISGATGFAPAADELLKLRVPTQMVEKYQWPLYRLARREPQLRDRIFDYFLAHRMFHAAQRLVQTLALSEEARNALAERLDRAGGPYRGKRGSSEKPGIVLEGPFLEHSSLARINREIATSLIQSRAFDVALAPTGCTSGALAPSEALEQIKAALNRHPARVDLTIRHQWPPDFSRPECGKLAVILPWEYGAVPLLWVNQINNNVDELWVPSKFVRRVLVRCGVRQELVRVIPNGIDPDLFAPNGVRTRPQATRQFLFLFVGGAIRRKGIDLLLSAYCDAFEPGDDVTLLVTALGSRAAYQHNSQHERVISAAWNASLPHVELLTGEIDDSTLANLYRGCDAFVLPYRAEGFCMPVLEAMACGKPVITTAEGPSQDFCSPATEYLVPASECQVPEDPPAFGPLAGEFTWFEPDTSALAAALRRVYQDRQESVRRGATAAARVRDRFAWSRILRVYQERIHALTAPGGFEAGRRVTRLAVKGQNA